MARRTQLMPDHTKASNCKIFYYNSSFINDFWHRETLFNYLLTTSMGEFGIG